MRRKKRRFCDVLIIKKITKNETLNYIKEKKRRNM
jgi:hypothetical protein